MFDFLLGDDVRDAHREGAAALRDIDLLIVLDISDVKRLGNLTETVRALHGAQARHRPSHRVERSGRPDFADTITPARPASSCTTWLACSASTSRRTIARVAVHRRCSPTPAASGSATRRRAATRLPAHLLATGVDPEEMYVRVYASAPAGRVRLLADVLSTLGVDESRGPRVALDERRRAREVRRAAGGPRRHRRARAIDCRHAHGAFLSRPRATAR